MTPNEENRRLGSTIIDCIGDMEINVAAFAIGPCAEHGWELQAWDEQSEQSWAVHSDSLYLAACELANLVGFELEDG